MPVEDQNVVAARWLEEIRAEKFAATTAEQWDKLVNLAKRDIAEGDATSLDNFLAEITE